MGKTDREITGPNTHWGEFIYKDDFRPFIVNQGVNMIEIDVSMAGGLLEAKKIADFARHTTFLSVPTMLPVRLQPLHRPTGPPQSGICSHEAFIMNPMNRAGKGVNGDPDVLGYDKEMIVKGHLQLSDRPGFGFDLNEKLIRENIWLKAKPGGNRKWKCGWKENALHSYSHPRFHLFQYPVQVLKFVILLF